MFFIKIKYILVNRYDRKRPVATSMLFVKNPFSWEKVCEISTFLCPIAQLHVLSIHKYFFIKTSQFFKDIFSYHKKYPFYPVYPRNLFGIFVYYAKSLQSQ